MKNYIAYDDEGIFAHGTLEECKEAVREIIEDGTLTNVYNENELIEMHNYFSRTSEGFSGYDVERIDFSGFTVKKVI